MAVAEMLLLFIAVISFIAGAIILTPLGIILLAFAIYTWKELRATLLRIGRWSTQRQNFVPLIVMQVVISVFLLIIGLSVGGIFGFTGLSILVFIWLLLIWLFILGLVALPILIAIAIWVVQGIQWLWPRYRERFWSAISSTSETSSVPTNKPQMQVEHKGENTEGLKPFKKPNGGVANVHKESQAGDTLPSGNASNTQEYDKGLKPDKKQKNGSTTVQKKKSKADGNSLLDYPDKLLSKILKIFHLE